MNVVITLSGGDFMKKLRFALLMLLLEIVFGSLLLASGGDVINNTNTNTGTNIDTGPADNLTQSNKNKITEGFIVKKKKDAEIFYVFNELKTGYEYDILDNEMNDFNIMDYLNTKIKLEYEYNVEDVVNSDGDTVDRYEITSINKIEIVYNEIEIYGSVSLRGSPPKLTLTTENDDSVSYEFYKSQDNYDFIVSEYQGYKVKITGTYFSMFFKRRDLTSFERRYLIVDKIDIVQD